MDFKDRRRNIEGAWKSLKAAADARSKLLVNSSKSSQFFANADDAEYFIKDTKPLVLLTELGSNEEASSALFKRHDEVEGEIESYEFNIKALRTLATQLIEANHADKEKIIERQNQIDKDWSELRHNSGSRKRQLEDALELHLFNREADELSSWIDDQEAFANDPDYGKDPEAIAALKRKFENFEREFAVNQAHLKDLNNSADRMIKEDNPHANDADARRKELNDRMANLHAKTDARKEALDGAAAVFDLGKAVDALAAALREKEPLARSEDYGRDLPSVQALQKKHDALARDIAALDGKAKQLSEDVKKTAQENPLTSGPLVKKQEELQEKLKEVQDLVHARGEKLNEAAELARFNSDYAEAATWIADRANEVTAAEVPKDLNTTQLLIKKNDSAKVAVEVHDEKIKAVDDFGNKLVQGNHFAKDEVRDKLKKLHDDRAHLGKALEDRKKELEEAYALQKFNGDQQEVMNWLGDKKAILGSSETASDLAGAEKQLKKHEELKAAIDVHDERVHAVKALGEKLIQADHSAKGEIRDKIDAVTAERALVAESLDRRHKQLKEARDLAKFNEEQAEAKAWIRNRRDAVVAETPSDLPSVQIALKKNAEVKAQAQLHDQRADGIKKFGEKLIADDHFAKDAIKEKVDELSADQKSLHEAIADRQKQLEDRLDLLRFDEEHRDVVAWIKDKNDQVHAGDYPLDIAAAEAALKKLQDQRTQIGAHDERVKAVQRVGDGLIAKNHPQTESIRAKLDELANERKSLADAISARQKQVDDALALHKFNNAHAEVDDWIDETTIAVSSTEPPKDVESAIALLRQHNERKAAIEAYNARIEAVELQGEKLIADGHPQSQEVQEKLDSLRRKKAALLAAWDTRKKQLEDALTQLRFDNDYLDASEFIKDKRDQLAELETPKDLAAAEAAIKKVDQQINEVNSQNNRLNKVDEDGKELLAQQHPQSDAIKAKIDTLAADRAALDKALADRKKQLEEARDLLAFNNDHQEAADFLADTNQRVAALEPPKDEAAAQQQLKDLSTLADAVEVHDDQIKKVEEQGRHLIDSNHPDKPQIENKLKELAAEREKLANALNDRKRKIAEAHDLFNFDREAQDAEDFLQEKEAQLAHPVAGDSVGALEALLKKQEALEQDLEFEAEKIKALNSEAQKLIDGDHYDRDNIKNRRDGINSRFDKVNADAAKRKKELEEALELQKFLADVDEMADWLKQKKAVAEDDSYKNDPSSLADKRNQHEEFIRELAANRGNLDKLRKEQQKLEDKHNPNAPEAKRKLDELDKLWDDIQNAAKNKSSNLKESGNLSELYRGLDDFERWFKQVEAALAIEDLGKDVASTQTLIKKHNIVDVDIKARKPQIDASIAVSQGLIDSHHYAAAEIAKKKDEVHHRYIKIQDLSKDRSEKLQAALKVQQFYRDINEEENYIAYKERLVASTDFGKDPISNERLVSKHVVFEEELAEYEKRVLDAIESRGKALISEKHYDASNVATRLAGLQTHWKALKEGAEKRRLALQDATEWVVFQSDAEDEINFCIEQIPILEKTEVGDSLSANQTLLKKNEAVLLEVGEHSEHIQDIIAVGERLIKGKNSHSEDIEKLSQTLKAKNAQVLELAASRKSRIEAALRVQEFYRAASLLEAFLAENESKAASTEFGKDLAAVARNVEDIENLQSAADSIRTLVVDIESRKEAVAGKLPESEAVISKAETLLRRWNEFLGHLSARRTTLLQLQQDFREADDLALQFAEKASLLNNWIDNIEEDLSESVLVDSVEEVKALQAAHATFQETLTAPTADYNALLKKSKSLKAKGMTSNPYTAFTMESITERWKHVLDSIEDRTELLSKEFERQEENDKLRKEFADKANAFASWMIAERLALVENVGTLEEQLKATQQRRKTIAERSSELKAIEEIAAKLEKHLILDNQFTEHTAVSLSQMFEGLEQLCKRNEYNLDRQIQAKNQTGVKESEINEWTETFEHFDRNRSGKLPYVDFKSCLRALGYDLPVVAEGVHDAQFEAIVTFVDPNNDGTVSLEEFIAFMINQRTTKVESAEEIIDAFQMLAEGKPYVTEDQLRAVLTPSQLEYAKQLLQNYNGEDDKYDFRSFTHTLFSDKAVPPSPSAYIGVETADTISKARAERIGAYQNKKHARRTNAEAARKAEEERANTEKIRRDNERAAILQASRESEQQRKIQEENRLKREEESRRKREAEAKRQREEEEHRRVREEEEKRRVEQLRRAKAAEERAKREAEALEQRERERKAREEDDARRKAFKEEKERVDSERRAKEEEERRQRDETEAERVRRQVEERARRDAEERAKRDAEFAKRQADEKAKREAEELARLEVAQEAERKESEERAQRQEAAQREAAEKQEIAQQEAARKEAEAQAQGQAVNEAQREAEEKAQREAVEKAQREAEEKVQREAEEKAQREAAEKAQHEAEEKAQREAAEKAQREAEERAQREAAEKVQQEVIEKAQPEAAAAAVAASVEVVQETHAKNDVSADDHDDNADEGDDDDDDDDDHHDHEHEHGHDQHEHEQSQSLQSQTETKNHDQHVETKKLDEELTAEQIIGLVTTAIKDKVATQSTELMFLEGDQIKVKAILGNDQFRGESHNVEGMFFGSEVKIPDGRVLRDVSIKASLNAKPAESAAASPSGVPKSTSDNNIPALSSSSTSSSIVQQRAEKHESTPESDAKVQRRKSGITSLFSRKDKTEEEKLEKERKKAEKLAKEEEEKRRKEEEKRKKEEEEKRKKEEKRKSRT